jgi:serine/threonine-protein kinase HipA
VEAGTAQGAAISTWDALGLVYLANAGSGAGGARPKALIQDGDSAYLAKFNRLHGDSYNNARVELACLRMAAAAGIAAADAKVISGINGREVLLIKRFDVDGGHRRHLITVNALLKDPQTQRDRGGVFRYDDVAELIRRLSAAPQQDLEQLLRLMLFNAAIHNTDDHERNFSFRFDNDALRLAPAYDLVPSLSHGEYHAAGYGYAPSPPRPGAVSGRVFGLPKPRVEEAVDAVMAAVSTWPEVAAEAGIAEAESHRIGQFMAGV